MGRPIELNGVIHGKTITLDEEAYLPDGFRVKLHLILEPVEALRLAAGSWADMTPEQIALGEKIISDFLGRPFKLPRPGEQ